MKDKSFSGRAKLFGDGISSVLKSIVALCLLVGIGINFSNVVGRFVFSAPIHWAEEILTFMLIWVTFLAAGAIAWEGTHLSIDLLQGALKRRFRLLVAGLGVAATIAISLMMLKQSWSMVSRFLSNEQTSLVAELQLEWAHGPVPVGFAVMAFLLILRFFSGLEVEHDILEEEAGALDVPHADDPLRARDTDLPVGFDAPAEGPSDRIDDILRKTVEAT